VPGDSFYAQQRARLREAAAAIAGGQVLQGEELREMLEQGGLF
jgi:hypothetical protein